VADCGTAFRLNPTLEQDGAWTEVLIHIFEDGSDGAQPAAGLVLDGKGSLLGTAAAGANSGVGVVYRLTQARDGSWKETVLYEFIRGDWDGAMPQASLIFDAAGNLYSTTTHGGPQSLQDGNVFRLKPPRKKKGAWRLDVLYTFAGSPDGAAPAFGVIFDKRHNLYGTTTQGGSGTCPGGCGTVFEVSPRR